MLYTRQSGWVIEQIRYVDGIDVAVGFVRMCVYLSREPHQMWSASIRRQGLEKQLRREELLRLQLEENRKRKETNTHSIYNMMYIVVG